MVNASLPLSPVFDAIEDVSGYGFICQCGAESTGFARQHEALAAGSDHGCARPGIAGVYSGRVIRRGTAPDAPQRIPSKVYVTDLAADLADRGYVHADTRTRGGRAVVEWTRGGRMVWALVETSTNRVTGGTAVRAIY